MSAFAEPRQTRGSLIRCYELAAWCPGYGTRKLEAGLERDEEGPMLRVRLAPVTSLSLLSATALSQAPVAPLFASDEVLTFTIQVPLTTIFKVRADEHHERPSKVILPGSEGRNDTV